MPRNLHHANLLIGDHEEAESYFSLLCKRLSIKIANNPDLVIIRIDTFGIDEARELRVLSTRKALGDKKMFLIVPTRLTIEAQNALLKTFEDPFPNTYFFLAVREEHLVVPTLRSRMQAIRVDTRSHLVQSVQGETLYQEVEEFLSLPIKERLSYAKSFAEDEKNLQV